MDKTEKTEDSGNLIVRGEFYTLENIKAMIIEHLTEKEIEEEELLIKRLSINVANTWKNNLEKFDNSNNKVEDQPLEKVEPNEEQE